MGGLEIAAALLGVINVVLVVRRSIWNFPFGMAMVSLYAIVFWEARLYSDALLQIFFLVVQIYGWWAWSRADRSDEGVAVSWMIARARVGWALATVFAILAWGLAMARWTDAAAPMADACVAWMSVTAQFLQSFRKVESWLVWILVDVVAIGVFMTRGLQVTAALYAIFLLLSVAGLIEWRRKAHS